MKQLIFSLLFLSPFLAFPAAACECASESFSPEASQANIEGATMIFEGEVLSVESREFYRKFIKNPEGPVSPDISPYFSRVTLKIKDLYKGQPAEHAIAYFDTVTSCGFPVTEGDSGLYILNEYMGDLTAAGQCGSHITLTHLAELKRGDYKSSGPKPEEETEEEETEEEEPQEEPDADLAP